MSLSFYILLWVQGGNDLIASTFDVDVFLITWTMRIAIFVVPPLVFVITKRICFGLAATRPRQAAPRLRVGSHQAAAERQVLRAAPADLRRRARRHPGPGTTHRSRCRCREKYDANGIKQKGYGVKKLQAKLSQFFYDERLPMPTAAEIDEANHHEAEVTAERDHEIDDARTKALAPHE